MSMGRATLATLVGLVIAALWMSWLVMLVVGSLAGMDVVNATVGFVDAIPLGFGLVLVGLLPLVAIIMLGVDDARKTAEKEAQTREDPAHP